MARHGTPPKGSIRVTVVGSTENPAGLIPNPPVPTATVMQVSQRDFCRDARCNAYLLIVDNAYLLIPGGGRESEGMKNVLLLFLPNMSMGEQGQSTTAPLPLTLEGWEGRKGVAAHHSSIRRVRKVFGCHCQSACWAPTAPHGNHQHRAFP